MDATPLKCNSKCLLPKTQEGKKLETIEYLCARGIAAEEQFLHCLSELTPDVLFDGSETLD